MRQFKKYKKTTFFIFTDIVPTEGFLLLWFPRSQVQNFMFRQTGTRKINFLFISCKCLHKLTINLCSIKIYCPKTFIVTLRNLVTLLP